MRAVLPWALAAIACATTTPGRPPPTAATGSSGAAVELAYAEAGAGAPIVLIHGAWGDLRTFARAIPVLSAGRRLIVPSLRYHWPNPWAPSDEEAHRSYTVATHAADVAALIERLGIGPVDLVGHSYGGTVAAALAAARPDLVRRLVLVEPALHWLLRESEEGRRILDQRAAPRPARLARARAGEDPVALTRDAIDEGTPGVFDALPVERRRLLVANARTTALLTAHPPDETRFTCEDAGTLRAPVLLIQGEKTARQYQAIVSRLAECIAGARTIVLPGSRHVVQADAPEAMARAVLEFVGP